MSMTSTAAKREQADGGALATAAAALKRLGAAYISWRLAQSAMAVLSSMSERELADVGLSRSDITVAVRSGKARGRRESCEL